MIAFLLVLVLVRVFSNRQSLLYEFEEVKDGGVVVNAKDEDRSEERERNTMQICFIVQ